MRQYHPVLEAIGETLMDTAFFGFFIFFAMRPFIQDFFFLPVIAILLALRLINYLLLRRSVAIGVYGGINLFLALGFIWFSMNFLVTFSFSLPSAIVCILSLAAVFGRTVYLSLPTSRQTFGAVGVDTLFVLCLIISIWQNFSKTPGLSSLMSVTLWALVWGVAVLAFQRLPGLKEGQSHGFPILFTGVLAAIFCILSLAAAFLGKTASQGFISGFLALIRGIKLLFTAVWHFFVSILEKLFSLFPETSDGYLEPYEMSDQMMADMEERAANMNPQAFFLIIGICLAAAAFIALYCLWKKGFFSRRLQIKSTAKNVTRKRISGAGFFSSLLCRIGVFFKCISMILFRPSHISTLLLRAEWYGKRRLHPRRRAETIGEYLTRLEALEKPDKASSLNEAILLLTDYGNRYLYSKKTVRLPKKDICKIKKAFPLI